ncbi:MAG: endonuclease/exonuclease/phosphatase family protein [Planctomycetaceae bacterium]|nr:endonuclease/exonuclease/phosphatase family protein [Planctomycetaceae bacterium]
MKNLISIIIVCFLASSAWADTLCVATYNLNYANRRGDQVLDAIATADPDLVCFQETTIQSEGFLREHLKKTHPFFYSVGHKGQYYAERFAFASKTKLTDVKFTEPNAGLFGFYAATAETTRGPIQVVNAHLSPFQFKRGGGIADAMSALSATEEVHATEIAAIVEAIDRNKATIVLGDFNSISTFAAPKRLVELGMIDAFASLHEDSDAHPTWSWPTRPIPISLRIDYIFHTPHFTTTKSGVLRRVGSDHAMLYAVLKVGEQADAHGAAKSGVLPVETLSSRRGDRDR